MADQTIQPTLDVQLEEITFTRSDGKRTRIRLLELLDGESADPAGITWATLMKLQGILEMQCQLAQQNDQLIRIQTATAQALSALAQKAAEPVQAPDPQAIVDKVFADMGLPKDVLAQALAGMQAQVGGTPGVEVSKPGGNGAAKPEEGGS
jgi:hypothetical protein